MADEGSLELAPLRAKVVLDLTQFDEGMEQIADKTDTLKDVNVPVKVEINTNSDGVEEITEGIEEANQETEQLADNLEGVNENVEQVAESTKAVTENLNEAKQAEEEMGRHDFIINYNGEKIHAMQQSIEELTNATHIYEDALARLNATEEEFDETLSLDFSTIEEFNEEINASIESLKEMINESKGLNVDLTEAQEALKDYIPLWEELTKEQQEEFKSVGEVEYNLQALQTRFSEVSNAIDNLGDAMEKSTAKQQQFNNAVKQTKVDVSEYNQEAMEFIAGAERQAEATEESSAQLHTNGTAVSENATMVEKWGNDWWSSATMAVMGIEMVKGTFETYANDALEVQQSTIGLSHTFGTVGAESIENFCQSANNANLSLHDVLPYAQELGLALQQYGGTKTEVAGVAEEIISMANQLDVATGGAISFDEAVDALRADIGGQDFELEELGINISKTAEKQAALNSKWHEAYSKMSDYQKEVIDMQVVQNSLNKTFGQTSTYLDSTSGSYEKATAKINNDLTYIALDLLPIAVVALDKVVEVMNKIKAIADKIKSNKWLMNKIEWFTKLALTGGTVALALAIVGKAFSMLTKRIRYVISATKDMVSIFKGASKFNEMRTGIGKLILAFKKLIVGIGKGTATIVKTIPKIGKAFIQVGKVIGSNAIKIASILKKTVIEAILKCSSSIKTIAIALGTKIINLISEGMLTSKVIFMTLQGIISTAIEGVVGKLTIFANVIKSTVIPTILEFLADIGPVGWALLATIGIITVVYEAWKHNWFDIRNVVKIAIEDIKNILKSLRLTGVIHFFKSLNTLCSTFQKYSEKSFKSMVNTILGSFKDLGTGVVGVFNYLKSEYDKFNNYEEEKTKKSNEQMKSNILKSWTETKNFLKGIYNDIYSSCKKYLDDQETYTTQKSAHLQEIISQAWTSTANFTESCLNSLGDFFNNKLNELGNLWNEFWNSIALPVINALDYVGEICSNAWNQFWDFLGNISVDVLNWIGNLGAEAVNSVNNFLNNILGDIFGGEQSVKNSSFISFANLNDVGSLSAVPTVNNFSTTNINNTTSTNLSTIQTQTDSLPTQSIPTIGELHIHSPQNLDPLETYNQMQQWSINMANGLY